MVEILLDHNDSGNMRGKLLLPLRRQTFKKKLLRYIKLRYRGTLLSNKQYPYDIYMRPGCVLFPAPLCGN